MSTGICQGLGGGQEAGCPTSCWMDQHMMLNDPLDTQVGERPVSNYPSLAATYVTVKSRVFWHSLNTTKLTKHVGPVKSSKDCILFCLGFFNRRWPPF